VKSILECAYLTDDQIKRACIAAVDAGVAFVKSGTGWAAKPTTVENIKLMKEAVNGKAQIKAAGGVRSLAILEDMYNAGCTRFGIGLTSALAILKEACDRDGVVFKREDT
jgi:deoxyribose-phosphate aldolase